MGKEEVDKLITSYIEQSVEGLQIENPKFDFKEQWYDLSNKPGINEFLKDTSAIANTFGPDGFIVIGYNDKTNTFHNATFQDSKLNDTSKITDLINKKIDRLFDLTIYDTEIDGHKLSVMHIPPSIDKPHVITNYQTFEKNGSIKKEEAQRIFVRKGTSTFPATKHDIELMFYDRKNILPEYRIQTSFHHKNLSMFVPYNDNPELNKKQSFPLKVSIPLTIENQGMRPASIIKFSLDLFLFEDASDHEIIRLESIDDYLSEPIILQSGHMLNKRIEFMSRQFINYDYSFVTNKIEEFRVNTRNILTKSILLTLSTGSIISSDLTISTK